MKSLLLYLLAAAHLSAASFVEFYVIPSTGSNLNSGSSEGAPVTYPSGSWDSATGVFTVASGDPTTNVTVGDFASVYGDGDTQTGFVGRVTARTSSTITVSLTAKSGTAPTNGTGNRTLRVGGPWAGMSGTNAFPFEWYSAAMTNAAADPARINFKAATYSITSTIDHTIDGMTWFQGYATTPGDGGKAIIDGGGSGAYFNLFRIRGGGGSTDSTIADFIFQNNGNTGGTTSTHGCWLDSGGVNAWRCVARNIGGNGFLMAGTGALVSSEAYNCNLGNNNLQAGISLSGSGSQAWFCISHHNPGSTNDGFRVGGSTHALHCISWANGRHGFHVPSGTVRSIMQCDAYANGGDGINVASTATGSIVVENCNLIDNVGAAVDFNNAIVAGVIANCGLGSGTAANGSGIIDIVAAEVFGTVTYPSNSTPWNSPDTGDFSITLAEAKNAGRGEFLQSDGGTTAGTPDIGAAFAADSPAPPAPGSTLNATTTNATTVIVQ